MSDNNLTDIKNQVLSNYFRLKDEATGLYANGYFYDGLLKLKTLISGVPLSEKNYKKADSFVDFIEGIEIKARKITGLTIDAKKWNRFQFKNNLSRRNFDKVLRGITRLLQSEGYFEFLPQGNSEFFDPSKNRKSFRGPR